MSMAACSCAPNRARTPSDATKISLPTLDDYLSGTVRHRADASGCQEEQMSETSRMMPRTAILTDGATEKHTLALAQPLHPALAYGAARWPVYDLPTGTSRDIENFSYEWQGRA